MKRMSPAKSIHRHQAGFVLPFALVLLVVLIMLSAGFFNRSADSAVFSGTTRDSGQAMLLAESALNRLMGQFLSGKNVDGQNNTDSADAGSIRTSISSPPATLSVKYVFYRSSATAIDQTSPGILQRVADGEARNSGASLSSQKVANGTARLKINDLFVNSGTMRPMLYVRDGNGLSGSVATSWDAETATEKVAVWIELTLNPTHNDWLDIYVQAAAQVGGSKAYVQRYIGSFQPPTLDPTAVSPISQS